MVACNVIRVDELQAGWDPYASAAPSSIAFFKA